MEGLAAKGAGLPVVGQPPFAAFASGQSGDWTTAMNGLSLLVSYPDDPASLRILERELSWSSATAQRARELYESGLPPLVDTRCLPYLFGVSRKLVAAMGKFPDRYYREFTTRKRGGGERRIEAPRRFAKLVQRWIDKHILSSAELPDYVFGFARGRSIFDHGSLHTSGVNVLVVDIEDFFPSVDADKIAMVFSRFGFPEAVADQLASLCSLRRRLPQGAPTSPALANLAFSDADAQLKELADSWECQYSRYADDLAFSGSKRFTETDMRRVGSILARHEFTINRSKSRWIGSGGCQVVTGLVVNHTAHPPRWKRRLWRAMFHRATRHPHEFVDREKRLRGIAAFVNQYDIALASEYRAVAETVARQSDSDRS
jgi:RNA-directed DNA polymerase